MTQIKPLGAEFEEYLRDESRSVGSAQTISFPTCEDEIRSVLRKLYPSPCKAAAPVLPVAPYLPADTL